MPLINSKGLVTNELLFEDDFEDGNLTEWSLGGTGMTITTSPAQGTYALKSTNNTASASSAVRTVNLSSKPRTVQFKFRIVARGIDDPVISIWGGTGGNLLSFNPADAASMDPARRMQLNGTHYTTLNVGEWYTLTLSDVNFSTQTFDFELRDSIDALESSDTGVTFGATTLNNIQVYNQLGDTSPIGSTVIDDIKIWGKGI